MTIVVADSSTEICRKLAEAIAGIAKELLKKQEFVTLCLSGGSTPKTLYEFLAKKFQDKIDWKQVHIFWGDERWVPASDDRNNAKMATESLLSKVAIPRAQIHRIRTDVSPSLSAKEYQEILKTYFEDQKKSFDIVLLGLGKDGHTLSIFPDSLKRIDEQKSVDVVYNTHDNLQRITLLPNIVNRAANIIFLVTGSAKSEIVDQVIRGDDSNVYPANLILPDHGNLMWYLDSQAAKHVQK